MNEQTMEKLVVAAWKETEKEHKNHVAERIKRRNEKQNKAHSTNGEYFAPVDQTGLPDTDCNNEENRRIHHDELLRDSTDTSSSRGDRISPGGMEERSRAALTSRSVLDGSSRTSCWMQRGSLEWNCVTQSNAGRTTRQLEQTHGRDANGNNSRMQCTTRLCRLLE